MAFRTKPKVGVVVRYPKTTVGSDGGFRVPHGTSTFGFLHFKKNKFLKKYPNQYLKFSMHFKGTAMNEHNKMYKIRLFVPK